MGVRTFWPLFVGLFSALLAPLAVAQGVSSATPDPHRASVPGPITLPVILNRAWTDTGLYLSAGQSITVKAAGTMNWYTGACDGRCLSSPAGIACPGGAPKRLGLTCLSLIGTIDGAKPFDVGASLIFTAQSEGEFFLGVNDDNLADNTGNWTATISSPVGFAKRSFPIVETDLSIPQVMHFCAANCMTLQWKDGRYIVTSPGLVPAGGSSVWGLEKFTRDLVVLHRHDTPSGFDMVLAGSIAKDADELIDMKSNASPVDAHTRLTWGNVLAAIPGSNEERERVRGLPPLLWSDTCRSADCDWFLKELLTDQTLEQVDTMRYVCARGFLSFFMVDVWEKSGEANEGGPDFCLAALARTARDGNLLTFYGADDPKVLEHWQWRAASLLLGADPADKAPFKRAGAPVDWKKSPLDFTKNTPSLAFDLGFTFAFTRQDRPLPPALDLGKLKLQIGGCFAQELSNYDCYQYGEAAGAFARYTSKR